MEKASSGAYVPDELTVAPLSLVGMSEAREVRDAFLLKSQFQFDDQFYGVVTAGLSDQYTITVQAVAEDSLNAVNSLRSSVLCGFRPPEGVKPSELKLFSLGAISIGLSTKGLAFLAICKGNISLFMTSLITPRPSNNTITEGIRKCTPNMAAADFPNIEGASLVQYKEGDIDSFAVILWARSTEPWILTNLCGNPQIHKGRNLQLRRNAADASLKHIAPEVFQLTNSQIVMVFRHRTDTTKPTKKFPNGMELQPTTLLAIVCSLNAPQREKDYSVITRTIQREYYIDIMLNPILSVFSLQPVVMRGTDIVAVLIQTLYGISLAVISSPAMSAATTQDATSRSAAKQSQRASQSPDPTDTLVQSEHISIQDMFSGSGKQSDRASAMAGGMFVVGTMRHSHVIGDNECAVKFAAEIVNGKQPSWTCLIVFAMPRDGSSVSTSFTVDVTPAPTATREIY